jgi:large subunit ribosomal protein L9
MKVVLTQDVKTLGKAGQVKEVADGYARNFLFARGLAVPATEGELRKLADHQAVMQRQQAKADKAARELGDRLAQTPVTFRVKVGDQHRLYGSITGGDIAEALSKRLKVEIDKRKVELEEPIKAIGTFKVPVRLAKDVVPEATVIVEQEG